MGWDLGSVGRVASAGQHWLSDQYHQAQQTRREIGSAIDNGVNHAEDWVDEKRADLRQWGQDHGPIATAATDLVSNSAGFTEGGLLGVYGMGKGVVQIADGVGELMNPVSWIADPQANVQRLETVAGVGEALGNLSSPVAWIENPEGNLHTAKALWDGVTEGYQDAAHDGDWSKFAGRLTVDVGSMLVGAGEANAGIKGAEAAGALGRTAEAAGIAGRAGEGGSALGRVGKVLDGVADLGRGASSRLADVVSGVKSAAGSAVGSVREMASSALAGARAGVDRVVDGAKAMAGQMARPFEGFGPQPAVAGADAGGGGRVMANTAHGGAGGAGGAAPSTGPVAGSGKATGPAAAATVVARSEVTPLMREKILEGIPSPNQPQRIIGAHSGQISDADPRFAVEVMQENADGTRAVKLYKELPDGSVSRLKNSTLFPQTWSDDKVIDAVKEVGDTPVISTRTSDGFTLHRGVVDGVAIEVIKQGREVIAGYPTGGGFPAPPGGF